MTNIYNETMMKHYKYGHLSRSYYFPDEHQFQGKYGGAWYNTKTKRFCGTIGWKGNWLLYKEFNVNLTKEQYEEFISKKDMMWVFRKKKQRRNFFNRHKKEIILIKLMGGL